MKKIMACLLFMLACLFAASCAEPPPSTPPEHKHELVRHQARAATCTESGYVAYEYCMHCEYTTFFELAPLGHTYGSVYSYDETTHSLVCERCGEDVSGAPHEFQLKETVKQVNCKEDGILLYSCLCGAEKQETVKATGAHAYEWTTVREPSAFISGTEAYTCSGCGIATQTRSLQAYVYTMPILYMTGDYTAATKTNDVVMQVRYVEPDGTEFSCYGTIHLQGATSTGYPKKNYTFKMFKDEACTNKNKVDLGWGKENKYCLKANYVDCTQARNIVACRLWSDIVDMRDVTPLQQRLSGLKTNAGAIDGYPIVMYMNGTFHGLYTLNVPKDEWMFDMDDVETEAILAANDWVNTGFQTLVGDFALDKNGDWVANGGGWELKYFGTEKTTGSSAWVTDSFNDLILFCQQNDGEAFKAGIDEYLDVDAAIDYLLYMYAIYMRDNSSKNILWATYDGKVWFPSIYDQDGTFGMAWDGKRYANPEGMLPSMKNGKVVDGINLGNTIIIWNKLLNLYTAEVLERYAELRATVLTEEHILGVFHDFIDDIPEAIYDADRAKWKDVPSWDLFEYDYVAEWVPQRLACMDEVMTEIHRQMILGEPPMDD